MLDAYRSGRIPHAWLIGGAQGIGKATLAYRMARFVLAFRNPKSSQVQQAPTLRVDPADPVARQITAGAHGGLLVLERGVNDRGVMRTVITVDETRETISFFGSTAAVDGWRVCIVDTVDELNPNAANALLKILEEPPQQSLFLLVSHAPSRVLPTILSRCRKLLLRPLETDDVVRAAAAATDIESDDPALLEARRSIRRQRRAGAVAARRRCAETAATHGRAARDASERRSARAACAGRSARHQRPCRARRFHRRHRSLDERAHAHGRCQCQPAAPCTAGGGMGKDRPRRARYRSLQSGAQAAGFLGVFDARGCDPIDTASDNTSV
ncbi:hypothetical protein ACVIST_004522 [Bradyrhizobium elkanii]